jgi:hypothetical protein
MYLDLLVRRDVIKGLEEEERLKVLGRESEINEGREVRDEEIAKLRAENKRVTEELSRANNVVNERATKISFLDAAMKAQATAMKEQASAMKKAADQATAAATKSHGQEIDGLKKSSLLEVDAIKKTQSKEIDALKKSQSKEIYDLNNTLQKRGTPPQRT